MSDPDLVTQAFALLARFVDDEPCIFDHHGYCQNHGLSERPCHNVRARELLDAWQYADIKPVVEHAQQYSGGGWLIRYEDEWTREHYPLKRWIEHNTRHGGVVGRRTVIVLRDWRKLPKPRGERGVDD